jgi:prepilin-type N-terminal cleavage/methylation domain-containing protein
MKPGMSLLEVIIAITIAAIVSLLLYQSTRQTIRVVKTVDVLINVHTELALFSDRIQKDINGIFVPRFEEEEKETDQKDQKDQKEQKKSEQVKKTESKKAPEHDIFILKDMNVGPSSSLKANGTWTFISDNSLRVYGESVPRKVRVLYELVPEKDKKNLMKLVRYESSEIDYKKFNKQRSKTIRGYTILRNIKALSVECIVPKEEEEKKSEKQDKKTEPVKKINEKPKPKKIEFDRLTSWLDAERTKNKEKILPQWVELKITIVDARQKREVVLELALPIFAWNSSPKPVELQSAFDRLQELLEKAGMPKQEGNQTATPKPGTKS